MKKQILIFSVIALLIGGVFFTKPILALFSGMSALAALQFILTFVLHITVGTICAYMLYTLPEIVTPWLKTLRWKRRMARKGRLSHTTPQKQKFPRLTNDAVLRTMLMSQMQAKQSRHNEPTAQRQDDIRIEF